MTLGEYLRTCSAKSFAWAEHDCATFIAGWARMHLGRDPLSFAPYDDAKSATRLMRSPEGFQGVVTHCLESAGAVPTETMERGNVALVRASTVNGKELTGAIVVRPAGRVAVVGKHGLIFHRLPVVKMWSVARA